MKKSYNRVMAKLIEIIKFLDRYSIGRNSSVKELSEQQDDLAFQVLISEKDLNSEQFVNLIKETKNPKLDPSRNHIEQNI